MTPAEREALARLLSREPEPESSASLDEEE